MNYLVSSWNKDVMINRYHHLITRLVLLTVNADTLRHFVAEWLQRTGFVVYCFPRCSARNIFMEKDYILSSGPLSSLQLLSFLDYMYRLVINIILCLWLVAELFSCLYRWKDVSGGIWFHNMQALSCAVFFPTFPTGTMGFCLKISHLCCQGLPRSWPLISVCIHKPYQMLPCSWHDLSRWLRSWHY